MSLVEKVGEIVTDGLTWGIDHSEVMFRRASKRNQLRQKLRAGGIIALVH
ncbi:MAG: hypothetical protein VKK04_11585 [Synechococcales bacterium]|nr:hypothetical protein [Synechococcales bacterium]